MTTDRVQDAIEGKSPITRGSDSYERTFNIKAIKEENGVPAEIIGIQIEPQYSPMHYDLHWSTHNNRTTPFRGNAYDSREKALEAAEKRSVDPVKPTVLPAHNLAIVFKTINDGFHYFKQSLDFNRPSEGDFLYELIVNADTSNISEENSIEAYYNPTSDTGGELTAGTTNGDVSLSARTYDGKPDDSYKKSEELIQNVRSWIKYQCQAVDENKEWVECPVVRAFEDDKGEEIAVIVESPLGDPIAFEFSITHDDSSPYWDLIDEVASGDPANLEDSTTTVYLRHRQRSFYKYGPYEQSSMIKNRIDKVISRDVNQEWELRATNPYSVSQSVSSKGNGIIETIKQKVNSIR